MHRISQINRADRLVREAEWNLNKGRLRKAARLFADAGDLFRLATLGLSARACYASAAKCWREAGKPELEAQAENNFITIPKYWD